MFANFSPLHRSTRFATTLTAALLLAALTGCTRDRAAPEPTVDVGDVVTGASATEPISGTQVGTGTVTVEVTGSTSEATSDTLTVVLSDTALSGTLGISLPDELVTTPNEAAAEAVEDQAAATPTPAVNDTFSYIVEVGDSIGAVAEKFGTDVTTIRELNYLRSDDILVGQEIRVPSAPGITQAGLPTPTPPPFEYTVQAGDALGVIAQQFGVDETTLLNANALADPNNLQPGQTLLIPGVENTQAAVGGGGGSAGDSGSDTGGDGAATDADTAPAADGAQAAHVVQPGEQLGAIAQLYGVSAAEIAAANGLQNVNIIRPGQELIIPGVSQREVELATQETYTVQQGDTLGGIAVSFGVTQQQIIEANDIANPNFLDPGQVLVIPQP